MTRRTMPAERDDREIVARAPATILGLSDAILERARTNGARRLRELAAGIANGGIVLVRNVGTEEAHVDMAFVDELLEIATALDGKTIEEAAALEDHD